jgi:hypothetical protein
MSSRVTLTWLVANSFDVLLQIVLDAEKIFLAAKYNGYGCSFEKAKMQKKL